MVVQMMRFAFFIFFVRPIVFVFLGLNVRNPRKLPVDGPAVVVANHNSHLDTLVLMSLFPLKLLPKIHPVAAADYFLRHKCLAWFAINIMGIIPISRHPDSQNGNPLKECTNALKNGKILILFPEGSRGQPEEVSECKSGIFHIIKENPSVPTIPVFLHGLGKALPKDAYLLVPIFCDVFIGDKLYWNPNKEKFMQEIETAMKNLAGEGNFKPWL